MPLYPPASARDMRLDIARGLVPGHVHVPRFGRNAATVTGADIWDGQAPWVEPTSAVPVSFVSASVLDTLLGTGARVLLVEGLNGSHVMTSETVNLAGLVPVQTVNSYLILHRAMVIAAGSTLVAQGNITGTFVGGGSPLAGIIRGSANQTTIGHYIVPAGYTAYLDAPACSAQVSSNTADIVLKVRPFGMVYSDKVIFSISAAAAFLSRTPMCPLKLPEKTALRFVCANASTTLDIAVTYDILLVANA